MSENSTPEKHSVWAKHRQKVRESKDVKKILNYISDLSVTKSFIKDIVQIRKKYLIPIDGFKDEDYEVFEGVQTIPEIWLSQEDDFFDSYLTDKKALMKKYELPFTAGAMLTGYIEANVLGIPFFANGLCTVDDFKSLEESLNDFDVANDHPVLIRVSPYASKRDILHFVEISFKNDIKPLQEKYKKKGISLGKARSKKKEIKERNDFIYANKDLPIKEIRKLLAKKKVFLDDGLISKVLSLEKKRRK
jgi:hypothetical protein